MWGRSPESDRGYEHAKGVHRYYGNMMAVGCLIFLLFPVVVTGLAAVFFWFLVAITGS